MERPSAKRTFVASLLIFLAGLGAAAAGGVGGAGDEVATVFTIPAPRVGDRATYGSHPALGIEVLEDAWVPDGSGSLVLANRLLAWAGDGDEVGGGVVYHFRPGEDTVLATTGFLGPQENQEPVWSLHHFPFTPGCYRHPLRGEVRAVPAPACIRMENATPAPPRLVETPAGNELVVAWSDGDDAVELAFAPGIPFPVEIRSTRDGLSTTNRLEAFGPGSGPPITDVPRERDASVPLERVDRPRWTLDDAGVDHPFPFSEAFRRALEDPASPELRDFLAAHEDAYVSEADVFQVRHNDQESVTWRFHVASPPDGASFQSTMERGTAYTNVGLRGPPVYSSRPVEGGDAVPAPPAVLLPGTMPTLASMYGRLEDYPVDWRDYGSPDWSFSVSCHEDCTSARIEVRVGARVLTHQDGGPVAWPPLESSAWNMADFSATLDADGRVQWLGVSQASGTGDPGLLELGPREAEPATEAPAAAPWPPAVVRGTWVDPAVLAATTGLAVVAALLYWAWPVLKVGPLALFTRVRRDSLLEHPIRRRIQDALREEPGLHKNALARRVEVPHGQLDHHLTKLREGGLVTDVVSGGYRCWFLAGSMDAPRMRAEAAARSRGARAVMAVVRDRPGLSLSEVARRAGMNPGTVHYHLRRLESAGAVRVEDVGGAQRILPAS